MEEKMLNAQKQVSKWMLIGGIIGLLFGGLHLFAYLTSGENISLYDALINAGMGILIMICGWFLSKGKLLVFVFVAITIALSIIYAFLVGRGFNYYSFIIGVALLAWLYYIWKRGALK